MYQRLQMLGDNGNVDVETRWALLGDSREQDFRAMLRALRARVVDVTGLIEDGSALGAQGEVQGRDDRPRRVPAASAPPGAAARSTPPSAEQNPTPARRLPPQGNAAAAATRCEPPAAAPRPPQTRRARSSPRRI